MEDPKRFADAFNYLAFDGEQILQFVPDYKVNLIVPKEIKDFSKFHTDLGKVMKYIAVADQKEFLNAVALEEEYQDVNRETARLLKEVVGVKVKMKEKEEVNMCKALRDMTDEAREEGRMQVAKEVILLCREFGKTDDEIMNRLVVKLEIPKEKAEELCSLF